MAEYRQYWSSRHLDRVDHTQEKAWIIFIALKLLIIGSYPYYILGGNDLKQAIVRMYNFYWRKSENIVNSSSKFNST